MEKDDIKIDDVEEVLDHKVFFKIPNNYYVIISAINKGIPVCDTEPNSNICKIFRQLAELVSDNYAYNTNKNMPQPKQKETVLSFLNLFKKKGD